jgi:hypothetical protein
VVESANVLVKMRDGSTWVVPRENLLKAKMRGGVEIQEQKLDAPKEESTLKKVIRGTALGAFSGAGIPETKTPIQDLVKSFLEKPDTMLDPTGGALKQILGIAKNLGRTGKAAFMDLAKMRANQKVDPEQTAHDLASLATQLLMLKSGKEAAETPLAKSEVLRGGETVGREIAGAPLKDIQKAKAKVTAENVETVANKTKEQYQARAKARGEAEAREAYRVAKNEAAEIMAKAKHEAKMAATEEKLSGKVTREAHARLKNARLDGAKQKLTSYRNSLVKLLSDNILKTKQAEEGTLDARYNDFKQKVLGVTKENPNGMLQSQLTPVGQAVIDAKTNILKGSRTSIPIFNDIMGRLKDLVEAPDGTIKPMEGQMIHTDQLRGYEKELGTALYEKSLPGDVRQAVDFVRKKIHDEVVGAVKDSAGQKAVDVYEKLSDDWSSYKRTWFDPSKVNPLPRIREMLEDPAVTHEGIPVAERIAKIVKDEPGQAIVKILAGKKGFGAYPEIPARLMAIEKKLGELGDFYEKIPVTTYPRFPKYEAPTLEEPETVSKYDVPKPPDIKKFDTRKFVEESVERRGRQIERYSLIVPAFQLLHDIVRGQAPSIDLAAAPALGIAIKRLLTSPKVIDWLSKGAP